LIPIVRNTRKITPFTDVRIFKSEHCLNLGSCWFDFKVIRPATFVEKSLDFFTRLTLKKVKSLEDKKLPPRSKETLDKG
jgi:hypothetical protein